MKQKKIRVTRTGRRLVLLFLVSISFYLTSCNVTRVVSTQSEYFQKGDTSVSIVTKTVESYDATKKF